MRVFRGSRPVTVSHTTSKCTSYLGDENTEVQNLNRNSFSGFTGIDVGRVCQSAKN